MKGTTSIARHPFGLILTFISSMTLMWETVALAHVNPSWIPTGSLNTPRSGHTATLLPNGKVLVAGGFPTFFGSLSSAELYDPATGTWSFTGGLNIPRLGHTATLLSNGKVLVAGGFNPGGLNRPRTTLNSAELYDPTTQTWSVTGSLNTARSSPTATLLANGKVLVAGGYTGFFPGGSCPCNDSVTSTAEIYDPATGTWSYTGGLNAQRVAHTATLLQNGKVLVAGGFDGTFAGDIGDHAPYSSAELYDPAAGTWSFTGSLNATRDSHTATLLSDGKVLAVAGYESPGVYTSDTNTVELYDPSTGAWSFTASISTPSSGHTATLLSNGKVLMVQGSHEELYDPALGTWSVPASLNTPRSGHTATRLLNGKVLVAGGYNITGNSSDRLNSAELYDLRLPRSVDFDGDGKTDITVYRDGSWYISRSSANGQGQVVDWGGLAQDIPVPGDYDGDGKTDIAVYRDGSWYISRSSANGQGQVVQWGGLAQDIPVPGDYDGDGKTDIAVYRDGSWYISHSSANGQGQVVDWGGLDQDIPVPGDYDGDGKTDIAVYRDGSWYISRSSANGQGQVVQWGGLVQDTPVPGDYDGDGKTDIAVYRDGSWYISRSSANGQGQVVQWGGLAQDVPVPGDYDGDGKTDIALYRDGQWFIIRSSDGTQITVTWGGPTDVPLK